MNLRKIYILEEKTDRSFDLSVLEQGTGVEPASEAWEATIIADILTLHRGLL